MIQITTTLSKELRLLVLATLVGRNIKSCQLPAWLSLASSFDRVCVFWPVPYCAS
jgi:hypothetical protein